MQFFSCYSTLVIMYVIPDTQLILHPCRELQIGLMELENEKNDAVDLAK